MPTVSLEDAVALYYIERNQDQNDSLSRQLRKGLSPEAKKIANGDFRGKSPSSSSNQPDASASDTNCVGS